MREYDIEYKGPKREWRVNLGNGWVYALGLMLGIIIGVGLMLL